MEILHKQRSIKNKQDMKNVEKLRDGKEFVENFVYGWINRNLTKVIGSAKGKEETWWRKFDCIYN